MKINSAQVIGLNTDQKASQVIGSDTDSSFFVAVLSLTCDDAFTKGRQFLSEISDLYSESEGSPADKINVTYKQAREKLKELGEAYDLIVAGVSGKILYLISEGKMEVFLKRGEKVSAVGPTGSQGQLISGFLQQGDKVLFATSSLISFLGEQLNKVLGLPVDVFDEEVSSKIAQKEPENNSLAGLVLELPAIAEITDPIKKETRFKPTDLVLLLPKTGRSRLIIAGVLIAVILAGIGFQYKSNQEHQKTLAFNQSLQQAKDDYNSALGIQSLNPGEAKNKLDSAKVSLDKALNLNPKNSEALGLKKMIEESSSSILQQFATANFPLFLDLDLVKKSFRAEKMSLNSDNLLLLDPGTKTLITVGIAKKNNQILAGSEQLGEATSASINGGLAFAYSKDKGITRVDITNQKVTLVSKKDSGLGDVVDIYGFAGNVYVLDTTNQQVWKYLPTTDGYSDKREYLTKGTKVDFANSVRMQIESSVYVLKKDGEIIRFTKGDKDNFSLGGLDKGVKDPKSFFVSSDTENLYLLDSGNSRLLVLTKTGQFKTQYMGDKYGLASDLVVSEKDKKVYLLEGSKIYSADLK